MFETFNTKDAVVWVDPLDGTRDFVNGNYPAVTVLIGLAIKNRSRIGIVHTPYSTADPATGKTIFGTGEQGAFKLNYHKDMTNAQQLARKAEYLEPFNHFKSPYE